jgi:hypothetical protein
MYGAAHWLLPILQINCHPRDPVQWARKRKLSSDLAF